MRQRTGGGKTITSVCAGLVFENEESIFLCTLWDTEVLKDEHMLMPLKAQDWKGEEEQKERGDDT